MGVRRENIWVTDLKGVVYEGRKESVDEWKATFTQKTDKRTLDDIIENADVFFGSLSRWCA